MEITNEIKSKVFAQYLGNKVEYQDRTGIICTYYLPANANYKSSYWICSLEEEGNREMSCSANINDCKLILKPISALTNEDAIEVAVLAGMVRPMNRFEFVISRHINYTKHILSEYFEGYRPTEEIITGNVWLSIFQYLQSKGYDIPQHLLGGKTLFECELAIYEN